MRRRETLIIFAAVASCLSLASPARADSPASKNKEGNRLFAQGKYQDAEKAYLEAQASMPGRPELSYNLGNTLIKQQKFDQALQALRQAISKGDKSLQVKGWYNAGNALFDLGNFQNSAQAYIQALRLDPSDPDAKHNLELALKKMQQQEQQQGQEKNPGSNQQKPEGGQNEEKAKNAPNQQEQQGQQPPNQQPANPQPSSSDRPQGAFSKERALQILDALQNQELAEQRKLLERQARQKAGVRDW